MRRIDYESPSMGRGSSAFQIVVFWAQFVISITPWCLYFGLRAMGYWNRRPGHSGVVENISFLVLLGGGGIAVVAAAGAAVAIWRRTTKAGYLWAILIYLVSAGFVGCGVVARDFQVRAS